MSFRCWVFFVSTIFCFSRNTLAQQNDPVIEAVMESMAANQTEDYDYTELAERLEFYKTHKINLNKTNRQQLQELVFLNPLQISAFFEHLSANGKLISELELQSIHGFDLQTINRLLHFGNISAPTGFENFSFKKLMADGSNDLLVRYSRYLEAQQGFSVSPSSGKSRYLGTPERIFTRYRFSFSNNIQFSLNLEKDAGEKYWNNNNGHTGPDFVSSSLYIKDLKRFKKIVIGDYSLQFGQGLTLWSGLGFGKGAAIFSVAKQDLGLKPYTSVNEFSFFRGVATQINFGRFDLTPFVSSNKLDAGVAFNPLTNLEDISNLQQSGLHRTENELKNRKRIRQSLYGANLQYNYKKLSLGLTAYESKYSQRFAPGDALYNRFDFSGQQLTNLGFSYSYTLNNTYFYGEVAHSLKSGFAYVNGLITSLSPVVSTVLFHRNYQKDYYSFYNQGIGESSTATNEKGFYGGIQINPNRKFGFNFYTDLFKFPWLKFGVDAPSSGYDILGQFNYAPNKVTHFTARYQFQNKQKNAANPHVTNVLALEQKSNYRLEVQYAISKYISLRNRLEVVQYHFGEQPKQSGYLAYQDVHYSPLSSKWSGNMRFTIFNTDGFNSRIYAYENDVLYGFSIPSFQNQGLKFYANLRYKLKRKTDLWLKYSYTELNGVEGIGSGLDKIQGDHRTEVKLQLRIQF